MNKIGKFICVALIILAAGFFGFRMLQKRAMVADIISDEAAWDYRDSIAVNIDTLVEEGGIDTQPQVRPI